jgi:hypothetical protein
LVTTMVWCMLPMNTQEWWPSISERTGNSLEGQTCILPEAASPLAHERAAFQSLPVTVCWPATTQKPARSTGNMMLAVRSIHRLYYADGKLFMMDNNGDDADLQIIPKRFKLIAENKLG